MSAQQVIPGQTIEAIRKLSAQSWYISWSVDMSLASQLPKPLPGRLNRVYMHLQSAVPQRMDDLAEALFLLVNDVVTVVFLVSGVSRQGVCVD